MNDWADPQNPTPEEFEAFRRGQPNLRAELYWTNLFIARLPELRQRQPGISGISDQDIRLVMRLCGAIVADDMAFDTEIQPPREPDWADL